MSVATGQTTVTSTATGRVGVIEVLAFLCELTVFALLAVSGWNLADTSGLRLALAFVLPAVTIALWGLLLAPRSPRRLPQPLRLAAQLLVFAAAGVLAVAADLAPVGWVLPAAAGVTFGAAFSIERRRQRHLTTGDADVPRDR